MAEQNDPYIPPHVLRKPLQAEAVRLILSNSHRFRRNEMYRRRDIGRIIVEELARHGAEVTDNAARMAFKSIFARSKKTQNKSMRIPFEYIESAAGGWGWYRFVGDTDSMRSASGRRGERSDFPQEERQRELDPTRIYGDGDCCVYAWCLPLYAIRDGDCFPIKIGWAGGNSSNRFSHFENMLPEKIHVVAEWRVDTKKNARRMEKMLQGALETSHIEDLPGSEWYRTKPETIFQKIEGLRKIL